MRNTKEIRAILSAIYCINMAKRNKQDKDIELVCRYAFSRLFDGNPNMLILSCVGKTKKQILKEVNQMMFAETQYKEFVEWKKYLEEQNKKNGTQNI